MVCSKYNDLGFRVKCMASWSNNRSSSHMIMAVVYFTRTILLYMERNWTPKNMLWYLLRTVLDFSFHFFSFASFIWKITLVLTEHEQSKSKFFFVVEKNALRLFYAEATRTFKVNSVYRTDLRCFKKIIMKMP